MLVDRMPSPSHDHDTHKLHPYMLQAYTRALTTCTNYDLSRCTYFHYPNTTDHYFSMLCAYDRIPRSMNSPTMSQ